MLTESKIPEEEVYVIFYTLIIKFYDMSVTLA